MIISLSNTAKKIHFSVKEKIMKRFFIVSIGLAFSLFICAQAWSEPLDVACDEWPPYQIVDDTGNVSGFSAEVVKAVFQKMGINLNSLEVYPWKRALKNVQVGQSHALFSANFTKERTAFVWYPEEAIVDSPWVIWIKKGSGNTYKSLEDLKGKTVGGVNGYSYTQEFWDYVKANNVFEGANSDETNFKKLHGDRFEYVIAELGNGYHVLRQLGINDIEPVKEFPIKSDGLFIIFNKKKVSKDMVEKFSDELKKFKQEPAYQDLIKKYLS
jgi:polar amino acid transport system substrate-binding protein